MNVFGLRDHLIRDELCYILDPKDVHGPDPAAGETFRVLKEKEERLYGDASAGRGDSS